MSKRDKYAPDYSKLYPGVEISPEVRRVLTGSDRKMKYCEFDLKTEQVRKCRETGKRKIYPAREDSLDRLIDDNDEQYACGHFGSRPHNGGESVVHLRSSATRVVEADARQADC